MFNNCFALLQYALWLRIDYPNYAMCLYIINTFALLYTLCDSHVAFRRDAPIEVRHHYHTTMLVTHSLHYMHMHESTSH